MPARTLSSCVEEMHDIAVKSVGCNDFGDCSYLAGLNALLSSHDSDLSFTDAGRQVAHDRLVAILAARLHAQRGWTERPGVLSAAIHRPFVIVGLARTGSTALHQLLSRDPQFQWMPTWLADAPRPRPSRHTWKSYAAYQACVALANDVSARSPDLQAVHALDADAPEECNRVIQQGFFFHGWDLLYPSYARWLSSQNTAASYHRYADVLRLVGATEPDKRWLLKSPFHILEMDKLLAVFPDACIIQTHRDPVLAIPSFHSLVIRAMQSSMARLRQPHLLSERIFDYWHEGLACMKGFRHKAAAQFFDVDHRCLLAEPMRVMRSLYEHFGLSLTADVERRMNTWVAANRTRSRARHSYTLDSFSLPQSQLRHEFATYRAQHGFV